MHSPESLGAGSAWAFEKEGCMEKVRSLPTVGSKDFVLSRGDYRSGSE